MAEGRRERIIATIERERVSAILRTDDQELAHQAMIAAVEGGLKLIEFTMTTPGALELIEKFSGCEGVTVGAGTVMTPTMARDAVAAGAEFLVAPNVDREVIAEAALLDVPSIPGTYTPTEMESAHRFGADFVKLFPAPAGGVEFVHSVLGPLPYLRIFPTAGVTPENFTEFLDAGCAGVGFVHSLFEPADLAARNFATIRDRAAGIMRRLQQWRSAR